MRPLAALVALIVLVLSTGALSAPAHPAIGAWRGSLDYVRPDGRSVDIYFGFNIAEKAGKLEGLAAAYQIGLDAAITGGSLRRNRVDIEFPLNGETARFSGVVAGDALEGALNWEQGARRVRLERVYRDGDAGFLRENSGLYEFDDGGEMILGAGSWNFHVYDLRSRDYRIFLPRSDREFIAGPASLLPAPKLASLTFEEGGRVIHESAGGARIGRKSDRLLEEEITFRNGDATLAGLLIRPREAKEPLPGVVVVWGSGRQNRYGFSALPYYRAVWLARRGFATLIYDKRGIGASGGSYEKITTDLLAGDMTAAVDFLAARPEVDRERVGLLVHSQSGIYAPQTMQMTGNAAFAVVIAATVVNGEIQEIVRTEQQLKADGWPQEDVDDAVATQILKFYYAVHRIGWDAYVSAYRRVVDKPWFESVIGSTIDKDRHSWDFWKNGNGYEPSEDWAKATAPVLYLTGDRDTINPVEESLAALAASFQGARASLLTIKRYERAEHSLFEAETGGVLEEASLARLHPYMEDVLVWLRANGMAPATSN